MTNHLVGTPNSSIFTILKEDHTLANMLRERLLKDPHVMFAGYRGEHFYSLVRSRVRPHLLTLLVPHPLFATFELRVMTDGEHTPREAIIASAKALVSDLGLLSREFTKEFELRKMVQQDSGNDNERK
jgi:DNA-directed RNA polymerase II subunit RPB11